MTESNAPYPPRCWWLKRLTALGVVVLVGMGGVRAWWGRHADSLLAVEHAAVRAAGHPLAAEDLNRPPVPAERNAAAFILRAIAIFEAENVMGPGSSSRDFGGYPPFPPEWHKLADAAVAANGAVFPLVRQARVHDAFDWGQRISSPSSSARFDHLFPSRELTYLLTDAALREHLRGNDAAALELIRDARHLARAVDQQPFVVSSLVAMGSEAVALYRLNVIAADLAVADGEDFPAGHAVPNGPATRGQVRALIAELLRPSPPEGRMAHALAGERVFAADIMRVMAAPNPVLRPMFTMEEWRVLADTRWYAQVAAEPTYAGAQQVIRAQRAGKGLAPPRRGGRLATRWSTIVLSSPDRAIRADLLNEMERRLAAVALAARLYRADHGRWPASIDALVPAYLSALPADPFAPAGEPVRYLLAKNAAPFGADRPIVYSVGENGTDETATGLAPLSPVPQYDWVNRDLDSRRDLTRWQAMPTWATGLSQWLGANLPAGATTRRAK